jgi:hypothetical protein
LQFTRENKSEAEITRETDLLLRYVAAKQRDQIKHGN